MFSKLKSIAIVIKQLYILIPITYQNNIYLDKRNRETVTTLVLQER